MKKTSFIIVFLCGWISVWSQSEETNVFIPHLSLGFVTSQVAGDTYAGFNKLGLHAGLGINTRLSEDIGLGMDLTYVQKGSRKAANPKNGDYQFYRLALQYAEVPVYMTYYQDPFIFDIGLSMAYLLSSSEETQMGFIPPDSSPFNTLDFGFIVGFNYELNPHWKMQTRYTNSIIPFRDFSGNPIGLFNSGQYHSALMFTIRRELAQ